MHQCVTKKLHDTQLMYRIYTNLNMLNNYLKMW